MVVDPAEYVTDSGHRAATLLVLTLDKRGYGYRASSWLTAEDCNTLSAMGQDVPINGDATTKWIDHVWTCKCGWTNTREDNGCQRCYFLHESP